MDLQRIERIFEKLKTKLGIGMRTITMPHGIPSYNLKQVKREVPDDEPPAWPINNELKVVGKRVNRVDALSKVTGSAKYTTDITLPGMLYGKILRSPYPHANIVSIDLSAAENYPGVFAVHVFNSDKCEYAGQPIVGVAGQSLQIAQKAVKLIKIEFEHLPFVVNLEEALKKSTNLGKPFYGQPRGDIKNGFSQANIVIEQTYKTQVQHHCCLEPHSIVVDYRADGVTIYASTQSTKNIRNKFAEIFELPRSKVRVICKFMGGGFGSKIILDDFDVIAGQLSKKSGHPVSLVLDRQEEFLSAGNRPNSIQHLKVGAKKDGSLTAVELYSHGTGGIAGGAGVGWVAQNLYKCPNFYEEQYSVMTNAGPAKPFRAPGNVQGCFAMEQLMDELAEKLGLDPLELRDRCDDSELRKLERHKGAEKFGWGRRKAAGSDKGVVKKGLGVAQALWPKFVDNDSSAEVRLFQDGGIEVRSGVQDIGTGTKTILAQVVAEELGLQSEEITVNIGDTLFPDGPTSEGSQVTGSVTPAARNAAYKVKQELFELIAPILKTDAKKLSAVDGYIFSKKDPSKKIAFKDALKKMKNGQITATVTRSVNYEGKPVSNDLGAVQFAEVSVDTQTGFVKVEKVVTVHSCGRPINIGQIESQIEGAVIQGLSYALYENRVMDSATGLQMNANMHQYLLPFSMEVPEIEIILIEGYDAISSTDAVGIGEPPIIATAPAIANAIYNAIGVRISELPITPDKVLNALKRI